MPGAYVAIARVSVEYPSFWWCDAGPLLQPSELVRIECLPPGGGTPLRVEAVCLPFVLVKSPSGESQTLDVPQREAGEALQALRQTRVEAAEEEGGLAFIAQPCLPRLRACQHSMRLKSGDFSYVSSPVSVPVLEPNLSASMPSRCSMLT